MRIITLLMILISCSPPTPLSDNLNRVGGKAAKIVERKLPLKGEGVGRIVKDGKITTVIESFLYSRPLGIEEGRSVILHSIQISLDAFQNDTSIKKFIYNGSFEINNLSIYLFSAKYDFFETPPNLLSAVIFSDRNILYQRYNSTTNQLETIYQETYEEALKKCAF